MNKIRKKIIINESYNSANGLSAATTISYDLTSATVIDLTGYSGELIINVMSNNATEILNEITGYTNVTKITLRPATGLAITVQDINYSGFGNIYLYAPEVIPNGTGNGFLTLEKRNTVTFYQTNFIDTYNPPV